MMTIARIVAMLLAIALGVAAVVAGEADDSPGLQGIGVILVVVALWLGWRRLRRHRLRS